MQVEWAAVGQDDRGHPLSQSYTDFRGARIAVNPLPVLENALDPGDQVDVCVFQALHEAGHSQHTRDLWFSTLLDTSSEEEKPRFEPLRVAAWLLNIAEDTRSEGLTVKEWPGFAGYFDRGLDWLWDEHQRGTEGQEAARSEHSALKDRMRLAFRGARFPERSASETPAEAEEAAWWTKWQADYSAGALSPSGAVRRGLDRLAEDPAAEREMAEMTIRDAEDRKQAETMRQMLERLLAEGVDGVAKACAEVGGLPLDDEEREAVRRLLDEGLENINPVIKARGSKQPAIRLRRPMETLESKRAFVGRPDPMVEAMRAALVFRPERPRFDVKLQRRGEMDDEELWRFGVGDDRLFTERVVEARPDTALGLLVDVSGSMRGKKLQTAQRLAQILLAAASDAEGVTPYVWAHTGDSYEHGEGADVFTIWEPGDPATRLGLIGTLDNGNNYDGAAIEVCVSQLRKAEQAQRVLMVISDGLPAGQNYGGAEAHAHVRQVCRWAESVGVDVISIAVDGALGEAAQAAMYPSWLPYTSDRQLPRDLTKVLSRYVR
jgi:hypothetical protein